MGPGPPACVRQPRAPLTKPSWAGQRLGPQGEQGLSPLWGTKSGFSPQLALRAHLHTLPPPQGKQGSQESQQCVTGGRYLVGSVPGSGRVPAAPLATLCNSWSSLQDRSHALGAAGQELPFSEVVCPQHHLTSARRTKVRQKSLASSVQAHVGYPS